jgi:hypothetical protein
MSSITVKKTLLKKYTMNEVVNTSGKAGVQILHLPLGDNAVGR